MYEVKIRNYASAPYNPNLAHVFYLAGFIESWGRGIEKICSACKNDGTPLPTYTVNPGDIMIQFTAGSDRIVHTGTKQVTDKVIEKVIENLDDKSLKILQLLVENPGYKYTELAKKLSVSEKTVFIHLKNFRM